MMMRFPRGGMRNIGRGGRYRGRHGGRGGIDGWAMLLLIDLCGRIMNMPRKPPVTLGIMLGCISIHFLPFARDHVDLRSICLMPAAILFELRRGRLLDVAVRTLSSPFFHSSDLHLAYNMCVFFLRGSAMERREGSRLYALMLLQVLVLSQILIIFATMFLENLTDVRGFNHACIVGFSGVLFALKYIQSHRSPNHMEHILSFQIRSRYVVWAELLINYLVVPNSSFLGHLCGILAGALYEHMPLSGGALSNIMSVVFPPTFFTAPPSYTYASGRADASPARVSTEREHSFPPYDSADASDDEALAAEEEKMVQEAMRLSLLDIGEILPSEEKSTTDVCASESNGDSDSWVHVSDAFEAEEENKEGNTSLSQDHDHSSQLRQRRIRRFMNE